MFALIFSGKLYNKNVHVNGKFILSVYYNFLTWCELDKHKDKTYFWYLTIFAVEAGEPVGTVADVRSAIDVTRARGAVLAHSRGSTVGTW